MSSRQPPWQDRVRTSAIYVQGQTSVRWTVDMPPAGRYALGCEALPTDFLPGEEEEFEWQCPVPGQPGETGVCTRSAPFYFTVGTDPSPGADDCGESSHLCTGMIDWEVGTYPFYVLCDPLRQGVVQLIEQKGFAASVAIETPDGQGEVSSTTNGHGRCLDYAMSDYAWDGVKDPMCKIVVNVEHAGKASLRAYAPEHGPAECHGQAEEIEPEACGAGVPVFDLPFSGAGRISQGNDTAFSHKAVWETQYAVDFDLPKDRARSPVDGVAVVGDYQEDDYGPNVILIEPDGQPDIRLLVGHCAATTGALANAKPGKGHRVHRGDEICTPGDLGFANGVHIHFHVLKNMTPIHYGLRFTDLGPADDPAADPRRAVHCTHEGQLLDTVVSSGPPSEAAATWHRVESAL